MSMFTMGVVLAAALLRPVLVLVGAVLAGLIVALRSAFSSRSSMSPQP